MAEYLWRAEVLPPDPGLGEDAVVYSKWRITKATKCGWWVAPIEDGGMFEDGRLFKPRWTSGKFASPTKEIALKRLKKRTAAYYRLSCLAVEDAARRCRVLGLDTPRVSRATLSELAQ